MCGSYADMSAGLPSEACKDFTGGVAMMFQLREVHSAGHDVKLWNQLTNATECNSLICCGTAQKGVRTNYIAKEEEEENFKSNSLW